MATLFRGKRNEKENKKIYIRIFRLLASNNSSAIDVDWNCTRCCVRMGWMIWLILLILIAAYIVADRKGIMREINELWSRMK